MLSLAMQALTDCYLAALQRGLSETAIECAELMVSLDSEVKSAPLSCQVEPQCTLILSQLASGNAETALDSLRPLLSKGLYRFLLYSTLAKCPEQFDAVMSDKDLHDLWAQDERGSDAFILYAQGLRDIGRRDAVGATSKLFRCIALQPFLWDAWSLLFNVVTDATSHRKVADFARSMHSKSVMAMKFAVLLHKRFRSSTTHMLFSSLLSASVTDSFDCPEYIRKCTLLFDCIENKSMPWLCGEDVGTDHLDVHSDWLYLRGDKNGLKNLSLRCAVKCPYRKEACYVHGSMYSLLRQHEHAVVWFKRALAIDPQYGAVLILLGNEYLELKKPKEAAASYLAAADLSPADYRPLLSLGSINMMLNRYEQAIIYLRRAAELEPEDTRIMECLAESYAALELYDSAIESLQVTLNVRSTQYRLHKKAALLYERIGMSSQTLSHYAAYFRGLVSDPARKGAINIHDMKEFAFLQRLISDKLWFSEHEASMLRKASMQSKLMAVNIDKFIDWANIVVFDYTPLQVKVLLLTDASGNGMDASATEEVGTRTFEGVKQCREVMDCIEERLASYRSRKATLLKTLTLLEHLLLHGSESFVAFAVEKKELLSALQHRSRKEVADVAKRVHALVTDRNLLFSNRKLFPRVLSRSETEGQRPEDALK